MEENILIKEESEIVCNIYKSLEDEYQKFQKELYKLKEIVLIPRGKYLKKKNISLNPTKKGRKKKNSEIQTQPFHSKFCFDNLLRKIKVMYHCFIVNFINDYIKKIFKIQKYRLKKVSGMITQNITKKYNFENSKKSLKDFLSNQISKKYKIDNEKNKKNIEKLYILNKEIKKVLDLSYATFYQQFFLNNNRKLLEDYYGIDSNTLTLSDQMEIMRKKESNNYCNEFEIAARKKFLLFLGFEEEKKMIKFHKFNKMNKNLLKCEKEEIKEQEVKSIEIPLIDDSSEIVLLNYKVNNNKYPIFSIIKGND